MKKILSLITLLFVLLSCDDPNVNPGSFQEIYFHQEDVSINLPQIGEENEYDIQILLNTRTTAERIIIVLKGDVDINNLQEHVTIDVNTQLSSLTLNTDFSYSFILEESTPITSLVNCDSDNEFSEVSELLNHIEGVKSFVWDEDKQKYYVNLKAFDAFFPEITLPDVIIYQSVGVLERNCEE